MAQVSNTDQPRTFTDSMRQRFKGLLTQVSSVLSAMGFSPNALTVIGLLGNTVAAFLILQGHLTWGGIVALIIAPFDALDGALARYQGRVSSFGAFLDSVTDRYSEIVLFAGLLIHFLQVENLLAAGLAFAAITGSLMVSYVKARAEAVGYSANTGILTRLERMLVLIPALILNIPLVAMWILAVLTHVTALQRVLAVHAQASRTRPSDPETRQ